jgi:hypothetical protein
MPTTWRQRLAPIVARIIAEVGTSDMKALRKALAAQRPPESWLYKVWLSEIRNQLKIKPPHKPDPTQPELF